MKRSRKVIFYLRGETVFSSKVLPRFFQGSSKVRGTHVVLLHGDVILQRTVLYVVRSSILVVVIYVYPILILIM